MKWIVLSRFKEENISDGYFCEDGRFLNNINKCKKFDTKEEAINRLRSWGFKYEEGDFRRGSATILACIDENNNIVSEKEYFYYPKGEEK